MSFCTFQNKSLLATIPCHLQTIIVSFFIVDLKSFKTKCYDNDIFKLSITQNLLKYCNCNKTLDACVIENTVKLGHNEHGYKVHLVITNNCFGPK